MGVILTTYKSWDDPPSTLPETNTSHLKMDGWKMEDIFCWRMAQPGKYELEKFWVCKGSAPY